MLQLRSEISKLEKLLITSDMKREEAVLSAQREIDSLRKQLKKALDKIAEVFQSYLQLLIPLLLLLLTA